ncbi:MAG: site-specific integrase [Marinobacter adhaerens]|uniref:Site-specific integrase n=1 Tax=Marinobacter adhaerens TaxID=1033846 RepID=A0A844I091_9GAMM|nr:site-specific integrase [Marinobacter adhaerens]
MGETEAKNENLHGDELREKKRHQIAKSQRDAVDRILDQSFSRLVAGDVPKPVPEGWVAFIFETACAGVTGNALRIRHNHLVRRLDEIAGEHGLEIPNRDIMIVVRTDTPPMTPRSFAHKSVYEVIEADFWNSLRSDGVNGSRRLTHDAGRLVYSMIWFGGLHSQKFLKTICGAITGGLQTAKRYRGGRQLYWVESADSSECSRWFPDPVTLMLLHRFNREHGLKAFPANAPSLVAEFVSRITSTKSVVSADRNFVRGLMDAASTVASLDIMGCAGFEQNAPGVSVSMGASSWVRLITGLVPPRGRCDTPESPPELAVNKPSCPLSGPKSGNAKDAIASILRALALDERRKSASVKSASYKALRGIAESSTLSPIVRVVASWCALSRLSVTASTIRRYLSEFAEPLIAEMIDEEDLNDLDEDDWEDLYAELLKASSSIQQRAYRSGVLRRFHHYLVTQHGLPDTYIEGVSSNGLVDAEILTPAEFGRTLSMLADEPDRRLSEARQVALILGYRCGLRRGEIRRLLLRDLQGLYEPALAFPTLIVRGNRFGATKTMNANRVLPLWALLTDSELDLVRRWYRRRVLEQPSIKRNQLVFCELHQPDSLMPVGTLIDPIQDAMRSASGTPILRFHHLRHSCATYSALRLMESYPGELFPVGWACSDDGEVIMPHWGEEWYAVLCGEDRYVPAFEKLQYLTFMMGHASPGQTIRTYTHLLDYAVGLMRWSVPMGTLSNVCQAELLGFTDDNLQQFRSRRGLSKNKESAPAQLAAVLGRFKNGGEVALDKSFTSFEMSGSVSKAVPENSQVPASALLVYRALDHTSQLIKNGATLEKAIAGTAALFGLSEACLARCYRRGEWLMDQRARNFTEEHAGQRNAFSLSERPDIDSVAHRNGEGGVDNPVQRTCPAPPKLRACHPTVELMYQSLAQHAVTDSERFVALVENVVGAIQRSHTQIKFTSTEGKVLYLRFLELTGFLPLAWVDVRAPENGPGKQQMMEYWSTELSMPTSRIRVRCDDPAGPRNAMGVAQIEVDPPRKGFGERPRQHYMPALRFVAFLALIAFAGRVYVDDEMQK